MHIRPKKSNNINDPEQRKRVLTKAVIKLAGLLELSRLELSSIIGLSEPTLCRMFTKPDYFIDPESKEGQLSLLLLRMYRSLDTLLGGNAGQCQIWLRSNNSHLNAVPVTLLQSIEGLIKVIQYLDAMRGKI